MTQAAATLVISRPVADDTEASELIDLVIRQMDLDPDDPSLHVEWFESDEVPPLDLPVSEVDQLNAHKRDAPSSVFFTVLVDDDDDLDDE